MMKKAAIYSFFLMFFISVAKGEVIYEQNNQLFFDTKVAAKQFNEINKHLATQKVKLSNLVYNVQKLEDLQSQAEICVSKAEAELKKINELLKPAQIESSLLIQQDEYKFLQKKELFYAKQLSECRFYVYRSKEVLIDYKDKIQALSTRKILERSPPIWEADSSNFAAFIKDANFNNLYSTIGFETLSRLQIVSGILAIVIGVLLAIALRKYSHYWLRQHQNTPKNISAFILVLARFITPLTFFAVICVLSAFYYAELSSKPIIEALSLTALYFVLFTALLKYLLYPSSDYESPLGITAEVGKKLFFRSTALLLWAFIGTLPKVFFNGYAQSSHVTDTTRLVYISVFIALVGWVVVCFYKIPRLQVKYSPVFHVTKIIAILFLLFTLVVAWGGFHQLAMFSLKSIFLTLGLVVLTMAALKLINSIYSWLDDNHFQTARKWRSILGVTPHKKIHEVFILKCIGYIVVLYLSLILLMEIWEVSPNLMDLIIDGAIDGFTFAEAKFIPLQIILGLVIFSLILLFGRFIATQVSQKERFESEPDAQVAIASLIVYTCFAIALLVFLLVVGVNFTGLAIIAGALSVGVGLGLQDIVNNFVSGLILLLEKPIKPGDRIVIDNTEGFVKKVRLRSTQISTLAKEDVIVPNADLITNQVTNYMFRDRCWRVVCKVGVAYGSPVGLVKNVLLDIASKHPDVLQDPPNQPSVLFRNFGESSLDFELWCIIHDVNKKFVVVSDLNFLIDEAFREHNITIAFPQRDVHIKNQPSGENK